MLSLKKEGKISILKKTPFINFKKAVFHGADWFFITRANAKESVTIMPVLENQKVILLETYRPPVMAEGVASKCIEWPAGMVGDERIGETIEEAIAAELLEETGYSASRIEVCANRLVASPGCSSETTVLALAFVSQKERQPQTDGGVIANWLEVDIGSLFDFLALKEREGYAISLSVYSGLAFLYRRYPSLFTQKK